jgi:hypothetical protein
MLGSIARDVRESFQGRISRFRVMNYKAVI